MADNATKFSKQTTLSTLGTIYKYQNRVTVRFVFDNALRNSEITDLDGIKDFLKSAHIDLDTSSDDWTFTNHTFSEPVAIKLSELSSNYDYTVPNVKKALQNHDLKFIPSAKSSSNNGSDSDSADSSADK